MSDGDRLLAEIVGPPPAGGDAPRLVYADWLGERGDEARAEFVRVQCEIEPLRRWEGALAGMWPAAGEAQLERYYDLRRRERELRERHAVAWVSGEAPALAAVLKDVAPGERIQDRGAVFRRGFVAAVCLPCADWLTHGPALVRAAPLETVRLSDCYIDSRDAILLDSPRFSVARPAGRWPWGPFGWHPTAAAALSAHSAACLTWAWAGAAARTAPLAPAPAAP